jgi:MinD-like ATPase involved in chromosome partitioning or flagellar assembly
LPDLDKDLIRSKLRSLFADDADVRVRDSVVPDAVDLWLVAPGAQDVLWSEKASDLGIALDSPIYGARYIFSSTDEALESGIEFDEDLLGRQRTWATRSRAAHLSVAPAANDDDQAPRPEVVVFYSFKGGVGRSTALTQAALGLAQRGRRVLLLDGDFEAPSLHHSFGVASKVDNDHSLIAALDRIAQGVRYGRPPDLDIREHMVRISAFGELYLMPAGLVDDRYAEQLDDLDIASWATLPRNPVRVLLDIVADSEIGFDVVLIDARTGLSDVNAPFLLDNVGQYVVCFFPSEQTADGTRLVVRTLIGSSNGHRPAPTIRFIASPLPRGVGELMDATLLNRALEWAYSWQFGQTTERQVELVGIPYDVSIARADELIVDDDVASIYEPIVDWLDPVDTASLPVPAADTTTAMRQELSFTDGTGEGAMADIGDLFVRTRDTETAERDRTMLVLGRKGTGKTTIFLHLLASADAVAITEPESVADSAWRPVSDTWSAIASIPNGLRVAWPILTSMRLLEEGRIAAGALADVDEWLAEAQATGAAALARRVRSFVEDPDASLAALDLLDRTNRALTNPQRIVFDGLDTMFGLNQSDQEIRNQAILALLTWMIERESAVEKLVFTAFLRTDIWDALSFANQSHLYGRQLELRWQPSDYLKTALKQALRSSKTFALIARTQPEGVDALPADAVIDLWRLLCGSRVRGAGTAFTDRWVWSRLQDGNGDHSPRYLIQLCSSLVERARSRPADEEGPPLRGRDFGPALEEKVSEQAWRSAQEEYPIEVMNQLDEVFKRLALTPFSSEDWEKAGGQPELRDTAIAYGIVAEHPREERRWIVPELYRYAVSVARRGPA